MQNHIISLLFALFFGISCQSLLGQDEKPVLYQPEADATVQIRSAIEEATRDKKHILVQVGGNWCIWCIRFHEYCKADAAIDSMIQADYVTVKLNYSRENKNEDALANLGFPQRFGFPVFVILNSEGQRLHTQDSGLLEGDPHYDRKKVVGFLENWAPKALEPSQYHSN